jgi:hypothetical protein
VHGCTSLSNLNLLIWLIRNEWKQSRELSIGICRPVTCCVSSQLEHCAFQCSLQHMTTSKTFQKLRNGSHCTGSHCHAEGRVIPVLKWAQRLEDIWGQWMYSSTLSEPVQYYIGVDRANCGISNDLDSYLGDFCSDLCWDWFSCMWFFVSTSIPQPNTEIIPRLGHNRFLPNPFQFNIHLISINSRFYVRATDSVGAGIA